MASSRCSTRLSMAMPDSWVRATGKLNVPVYRLSGGTMMNTVGSAPVLLLTSVGRRSGQKRTAPVVYLADGERLVVIGSNTGKDRAPASSHNLKANPDAEVAIGRTHRLVRARVAEGAERAELWRKANEMYTGFDDYDAETAREITVFVLDPR